MGAMRGRIGVAAAAGALLLGACGGGPVEVTKLPGASGESGTVHVARVSGGVRLTNDTGRGVAYAVWNRGWLALFGACGEPGPECVRLAPRASVTVPDARIDGWVPGAPEAIVRWWHVEPTGDGWRAGEIHEVVVPL